MKIALLGATGFVGSALLDEALRRGHEVTAIVRHPEKLPPQERLVAIAGAVYDPGVRVIDDPSFPDWVKPGAMATYNA